jgi:hypothetical protein
MRGQFDRGNGNSCGRQPLNGTEQLGEVAIVGRVLLVSRLMARPLQHQENDDDRDLEAAENGDGKRGRVSAGQQRDRHEGDGGRDRHAGQHEGKNECAAVAAHVLLGKLGCALVVLRVLSHGDCVVRLLRRLGVEIAGAAALATDPARQLPRSPKHLT